jgi:hypothetical protein
MVPLSGASVAVETTAGASVAAALVATGAAVGAGVVAPQAVKSMDTTTSTDNSVRVCFLILYISFFMYVDEVYSTSILLG